MSEYQRNLSKYSLRKFSEAQMVFANVENKEFALKNLSKKHFVQLVTPHYGKPICIVANLFRVTHQTFIECCELNGIYEWHSKKSNNMKKRTRSINNSKKTSNKIKKINDQDFIIGTYDNDDYDYVTGKEIRKRKTLKNINDGILLKKKSNDIKIDFSSDEENTMTHFLDETTVSDFSMISDINTEGNSDTDSDDNMYHPFSSSNSTIQFPQNLFTKLDKLINDVNIFLSKPTEMTPVKYISKTARKSIYPPTSSISKHSITARKSVFKPKPNKKMNHNN